MICIRDTDPPILCSVQVLFCSYLRRSNKCKWSGNSKITSAKPPKCLVGLALLGLLGLELSPLSQLMGGHSLELSTVKH